MQAIDRTLMSQTTFICIWFSNKSNTCDTPSISPQWNKVWLDIQKQVPVLSKSKVISSQVNSASVVFQEIEKDWMLTNSDMLFIFVLYYKCCSTAGLPSARLTFCQSHNNSNNPESILTQSEDILHNESKWFFLTRHMSPFVAVSQKWSLDCQARGRAPGGWYITSADTGNGAWSVSKLVSNRSVLDILGSLFWCGKQWCDLSDRSSPTDNYLVG